MPAADGQRMLGELLAPEIGQLIDERQTRRARAALTDLLVPETADVLMALSPEQRAIGFRLLPRDRQAEVFVELEAEAQEQLLRELNNEQIANLFNEMDPDDRAELMEEMPGRLAAKLLELMRPEQRRITRVILGYPEDSVGRFMTPEYLTLRPDWTVEQALAHVRRHGRDAESLDTLYVTDERGRLLNHVRLRRLIFAEPRERVEDLMDTQTVSLRATDDREEAVRVMDRYDLPVLPVIDRDEVLVGIVTFDDVADVAELEATEDIQKLGGMEALDAPYLSTGMGRLVRKRGGWLLVLFFGGLLTIVAMSRFEHQIEKVVALALFVPLIIASGGNSGAQAASLMIRAIAIGEVELRDWPKVLVRELVSGLAMGALLGALGLGVVLAAQAAGWLGDPEQTVRIGLTVAGALLGVIVAGTLIGSMLPFVLEALNLDPATGSTPLVATLVDVTGLLIYFTLAVLILGL